MKPSTRRKAHRETQAIHMYFCRDMTQEEIADELDVSRQTISKYINSEPSKEVQEMVDWKASQVRVAALEELQHQLKVAGEKSRSAEKPVKVWEDENGDILIGEPKTESGEIMERYPIPNDFEMGLDQEARYLARQEVRDILDQMSELVGAKDPQEVEVSGDGIVINMDD